ncbi:hypothetical protein MYCTH_94484 [Thermothelomyces thermophilus ATCC 42464]|uniref:F-box domain-containing protein n=1 Tax=Thermothelomyces thermophilus (strain ATCC 42464 / BCRC 31852 / DSM 1799) TaxID=573729 RepID=G2QC13_THET4|nr:uncharacterized protein MYCTH_94484 [Thermothelomyces thermophilus ATCC 42464]AEO57240.1 hypothetical protein MYCTH_94484 [Thermothelomyces thermophilus ATCC 42464]
MGQMGSSLSRLAGRQKAGRHKARSPSLILQYPADIIVYLCREHLPPESALALSLTCKSLFDLLFSKAKMRLNDPDREAFLLLLEKDVGHNRYYCHTCSVLHRFWSSEHTINCTFCVRVWEKSCRREFAYLSGTSFRVRYRHVRLVMNRHFLGPPNGLPLDKFEVKNTSYSSLRWREKWSAKILKDELFLSGTRTLSWLHGTDQALRDNLDNCLYSICTHVATNKSAKLTVSALHTDSPSACLIVPCRGAIGSCNQCLTDYDTTVERRSTEIKYGERKLVTEYWFITITSYHQLGSGRSPFDPKWRAFEGQGSWVSWRPSRDMTQYPQGAVREAWKESEKASHNPS